MGTWRPPSAHRVQITSSCNVETAGGAARKQIDAELVQFNDLPPSTGKQTPVMKLASSLAKNAAALAISFAVAQRPIGMPFVMAARFSGVSSFPKTSGTLGTYVSVHRNWRRER